MKEAGDVSSANCSSPSASPPSITRERHSADPIDVRHTQYGRDTVVAVSHAEKRASGLPHIRQQNSKKFFLPGTVLY